MRQGQVSRRAIMGMSAYTAALVACVLGGLTPRMGPDGKQICTPRHAAN